MDSQIVVLPLAQVRPDPEQPRKTFDQKDLQELAASIREIGLIQPIAVRHDPDGLGYIIIAGERRYRAHCLLGAETIAARVLNLDPTDVRLAQIVENLQRADVSPMEEGRAFKAILDDTGWSVAELAHRVGLPSTTKVSDRLSLLRLLPEYQHLVQCGQLTLSVAFEISRLPAHRQPDLFRAFKNGKAVSQTTLRQFAKTMLEAEAQSEMFGARPQPTAEERAALSRLEGRIERALAVLADGFRENEIVAARRIDPMKAETYADKLALMQRALGQMEKALRRSAAQLSLVA